MPGTTSSLPILTQRSSQRPTLGRKGSCQQSRRQRNLVGLARAAQQQTLSITARVQACSHWSENVGFSKPLSICSDDAGILCPNSRLAGRVIRVMGREILLLTAYFEHSVGFRSDTNCQFDARRVFSHERWEVPIHSGCGFQLSAKLMARSDSAWRWHLDQATGCIGGHSGRLLTHVSHGQRPKTRHHRLFHGVCMHSAPDTKM